MKSQFDELTKSLAHSFSRRAALKKFSAGLAGMALACFGLANKAEAQSTCLPNGSRCAQDSDCCSGHCKPTQWIDPFAKHKEKVFACEA